MEHIFSNKDIGISKGLGLNTVQGKGRSQVLSLDWFTTQDLSRIIPSPNAVVPNLASYQNPETLGKEIPIPEYPRPEPLGWDPGMSIFLSFPGESNVQPRWITTAPQATRISNNDQQVPGLTAPREGGSGGRYWLSLILSLSLLKNPVWLSALSTILSLSICLSDFSSTI